jgi:acyl carrier protein
MHQFIDRARKIRIQGEHNMTSQSDKFNRIASEDYDPEQIQEKIKAQKQAQSALETSNSSEAGIPEKPYIAPRTPTEKWLADTIAEWLELDRVSIDADFFELGGDSIKALRILSRTRDKFQVELPQSVLFSVQFTVIEIANLIDQYQLEAVDTDELAAMMDELSELSDEDAKAQLNDEE